MIDSMLASGELVYRRSHRAKRLSLQLKPTCIEVVIPRTISIREAERFVRSSTDWLSKHRSAISTTEDLEAVPPESIALRALDQLWQCHIEVSLTADYLVLTCGELSACRICLGKDYPDKLVVTYLTDWLRQIARKTFSLWMDDLSATLQMPYGQLLIRNQKTRWGSCNHLGDISLNLKLLFFAPSVAQYVMVHELCHTVHADHSANFWRLVDRCMPNYKQQMQALRQEHALIPGWLHA